MSETVEMPAPADDTPAPDDAPASVQDTGTGDGTTTSEGEGSERVFEPLLPAVGGVPDWWQGPLASSSGDGRALAVQDTGRGVLVPWGGPFSPAIATSPAGGSWAGAVWGGGARPAAAAGPVRTTSGVCIDAAPAQARAGSDPAAPDWRPRVPPVRGVEDMGRDPRQGQQRGGGLSLGGGGGKPKPTKLRTLWEAFLGWLYRDPITETPEVIPAWLGRLLLRFTPPVGEQQADDAGETTTGPTTSATGGASAGAPAGLTSGAAPEQLALPWSPRALLTRSPLAALTRGGTR